MEASSKPSIGTSPAVQWLGCCASTTGGMGLTPDQGTKVPHAACVFKPGNISSNSAYISSKTTMIKYEYWW